MNVLWNVLCLMKTYFVLISIRVNSEMLETNKIDTTFKTRSQRDSTQSICNSETPKHFRSYTSLHSKDVVSPVPTQPLSEPRSLWMSYISHNNFVFYGTKTCHPIVFIRYESPNHCSRLQSKPNIDKNSKTIIKR